MKISDTFLQSIRLFTVAGLLAVASAVSATDLGRLFTTADERLRIDAMRKGEAGAYAPPDGSAGATMSEHLTLNGTLRGSNGRQRVWINGEGLSPTGGDTPATMLYDGRVRLRWQGSGTSATLKPGQTLDKATGEVFEAYAAPRSGAEPVNEEQ